MSLIENKAVAMRFYKTHIVFHVTQNAIGEVTVFFERVESDQCH